MSNVIWTPQPKQKQFMERPEYEALYGGAAGGGKSDALLAEALRQVHIPHYKGLILRKTFPQLAELVDRSQALYKRAFPKARYNYSQHFWRFPSGAQIIFGSMQHAKDRINYQGKAYDFVGFDELTHFTWEEYSYLFSRNRPTGPGTRVYIRATANPGGVGHGWVKDRFITAGDPLTPISSDYDVATPDGQLIKLKRERIFVPSTVFDNKELLANDPNYLASLAMLPEADRQALLYGDWNSFSGQVFTEFKDDPAHYEDRQWTHVIAPFLIPEGWKIYRGFDFGYTKPFSVGWFAVDYEGRMYRIAELYGCTSQPNTGVKYTVQRICEAIKEFEDADPNISAYKRKGGYIHGIADPAIWQENGGESIAQTMEQNGIYWNKADHERLGGKMQCHYRLAFDEDGRPMFYVFKNCRHFIRTIPTLVYSETKVEDINTDMEDHIYDEWRYVCMENPINPRMNHTEEKIVEYDPLDLFKTNNNTLRRYGY